MKTGPMTYYEALAEHLTRLSHEEWMMNCARVLREAVAESERTGRRPRLDRAVLTRAANMLESGALRLEMEA